VRKRGQYLIFFLPGILLLGLWPWTAIRGVAMQLTDGRWHVWAALARGYFVLESSPNHGLIYQPGLNFFPPDEFDDAFGPFPVIPYSFDFHRIEPGYLLIVPIWSLALLVSLPILLMITIQRRNRKTSSA